MQVVAVKGRNLAGDSLRAQQLITSVPCPLPISSPDSLRRFGAATGALLAIHAPAVLLTSGTWYTQAKRPIFAILHGAALYTDMTHLMYPSVVTIAV